MSYSYNGRYTLATSLASTPEICDFGVSHGGMIFIPAGSSITSLTFFASQESGKSFLPVYSGTTAVTLTVASGRAYQIPSAVIGARALKIVADAAGPVDISFQER